MTHRFVGGTCGQQVWVEGVEGEAVHLGRVGLCSHHDSLSVRREFKPVMREFKSVMREFKSVMREFKSVMREFRSVMWEFKSVMREFKSEAAPPASLPPPFPVRLPHRSPHLGGWPPDVPKDELLIITDRAKDVLMVAVPGHIL